MDFKNRNREKPTFANINLQGPCNLKCYFCIGCDFQSKIDDNYLNTHFTEWKNLDEYLMLLKRDGINKIYLTGQNTDPLLYKYLDELIEYLEMAGFTVGVRTNGLVANGKMEAINKLNGTISFSIHSLNPDTNELITGSRTIPNFKELDEKVKVPYVQVGSSVQRIEKGIGSPGIGVTGDCELLCGCSFLDKQPKSYPSSPKKTYSCRRWDLAIRYP